MSFLLTRTYIIARWMNHTPSGNALGETAIKYLSLRYRLSQDDWVSYSCIRQVPSLYLVHNLDLTLMSYHAILCLFPFPLP